MKKYKIGDRIIHADSVVDAVKIMKQTMKDDASKYATIMALIEDEKAAVEAYNVAIRNLEGQIPDESLQAIKAIRDDENRHIENLMAVVNGTVTEKNLEDSVKDDRLAPMTYKKLKELGVNKATYSKWTQEQANEYIANKVKKSEKKSSQSISEKEQDAINNLLSETKFEKYIDSGKIDGRYITFTIPEDSWRDRNKLSEFLSNEGYDVYDGDNTVSILRKQLKR